MLDHIERITIKYLYHCDITYVKNGGYITSIWTANKLVGKRCYYNRRDILLCIRYYNIRNKIIKNSKHCNENTLNNRPGKSILVINFACYPNGSSSITSYKNDEKHRYIRWDLNGKEISHIDYPESKCLVL